ncbi:MAG: hypothetical protein RL701_8088 [Pseudomonadota bacterium]
MRISNSFSEDEIQVLEFIVQTLLRGGTPTMATRNAAFPSVCRKVQAMKKKVIEQKARPAPEESSVGTLEAAHVSRRERENENENEMVNVSVGSHAIESVMASVDIARAV